MAKIDVNRIYQGDASNLLLSRTRFPSKSVSLIMTSPPYAEKRKNSYGGIPEDKYIEWFLPISKELKRILKNDGSFVLNIKEGANGERQTYVLELILELRKQGWLWTEEYIWHKTTCMPGKWPNRFRDAWERCLHFTKNKKFKMYQNEVRQPIGDWAEKRLNNLKPYDNKRIESASDSGLSRKVSNWKGRSLVYPSNVLEFAPVSKNTNHSAAYPKDLPLWFIRLFTKKGDLVLDPFIGSGTTAIACIESERRFLGIEIKKSYFKLANKNVKSALNNKNLETIKV